MSDALVLAHLVRHLPVPALIADAGDDTSRRFLEFFTAKIRNRNTRAAYTRAVAQFCAWCEGHGIRFDQLQPMIVGAYIESHPLAAPTVKQHLAAIRMLCDYLGRHGRPTDESGRGRARA
jgi:site-specific recombinase XerD